jgi:DNA repair exonuclease SbcCD ATPase subunit
MKNLVIAVLGLALAYSLYTNWSMQQRDLDLGKTLADQTDKLAKLELELQGTRQKNQKQIEETMALALSLQDQINHKKGELNEVSEQLRRLASGEGRDVEPNSAKENYDEKKAEVDALAQKLQAVRTQRQQLQSSTNSGLEQVSQNKSYNDTGLGGEIQDERAQIKALDQQLKDLKSRPGDFNALAQINPTRDQIASHKAHLNQLIAQKAEVDQEWTNQQKQIHTQSGQSLAQLKATEDQLNQQYQYAKAQLPGFQRDWKDLQGNRKQETDRIHSLESDRDKKKAELSDLQGQLSAAQSKLAELGAPATH